MSGGGAAALVATICKTTIIAARRRSYGSKKAAAYAMYRRAGYAPRQSSTELRIADGLSMACVKCTRRVLDLWHTYVHLNVGERYGEKGEAKP